MWPKINRHLLRIAGNMLGFRGGIKVKGLSIPSAFFLRPSLVSPEVEQHSLPPTPIVGVDYPNDLAVPRAGLAPAAAPAPSRRARGRSRVKGGPEGEAAGRALGHPVDQEGLARVAVVRGDEVLHLGANVLPSVLNLWEIGLLL